MHRYDSIVVGAGVAGMTAALYLKRSNLDVLLLEKEMPGGELNKIADIENFPGYKKINGTDLALSIYEQLKALDIQYKTENVIEITNCNDYKIVKTSKETYEAKTVVLASGRIPRRLNIENEDKLLGKGISYCAICDGILFKGKDVAIVGGGDSALTGALFLSDIASKVYIINRSDKLRASAILQDRVSKKENIEILYNSKITSLNEEVNILNGIDVNNKKLDVKGLFIYIGFDPDIKYLDNLNIENNNGYIVVDNDMQTSVKGIYACGDIIDKKVYQLVTAASEAAIAATSIKNNL